MKKAFFFFRATVFFLAIIIVQFVFTFLLVIVTTRFTLIIADLFLVNWQIGSYIVSLIPVWILPISTVTISGVWVYEDVKKMLSYGIEIKPKTKPQNWWFAIVVWFWIPGFAIYLTRRKFYWKKPAVKGITPQS